MFLARCHKRLISLVLIAALFTYFLWLLQLKLSDTSTQPMQQREQRHDFDTKENNIYRNIENSLKNRHDRVLLLAETLINENNKYEDANNRLNNEHEYVGQNEFESPKTIDKPNVDADFDNLVAFLGKINAFVIDVNLLQKMHSLEITNTNDGNNEKFDYLYKNLLEMTKISQEIFLSFGIYAENLFQIQDLISDFNLNCKIINANGTSQYEKVTSNVYFICSNFNLQLTVFFQRGEFMWSGSDDLQLNTKKWFGDVARAMSNIHLDKINGASNVNTIYIPVDVKKFLFDYDHSKFIECNRTLGEYNLKILGDDYKQNTERNAMLMPIMKYIAATLEGHEKHFWLAGGTLLGWYRDCGIIPHTQDVDFAILSSEYETKIKKAFLGNKLIRLWGTLGLVNDSYEFRMFNDLFTFDMFLVYKTNDTHQWCGYQVNRAKFRRWLPNFNEVCSAELFNSKFMVPCDPVKYLNAEYGKEEKWIVPKAKNYTWSNVVYTSSWSDRDWPHVVKYYDKKGALIKDKVLTYLNKHSKVNIADAYDEDI